MAGAGIAQLVEQLICNSKTAFCYLLPLLAITSELGIYLNSALALINCDLPVFWVAV
jgi:hypothetical protein